jgi:glycosyltransferase involved in cell wall biosynthesis
VRAGPSPDGERTTTIDVSLPFVSVVIPTSGRADLLRRCLGCLARQDYPADRYQVIVVENGVVRPTRPAAAVAESQHPVVLALTCGRRDANTARNLGISVASGDPIVLIDDDSLAPPSWLRALALRAVSHPDAACLGGPVIPCYASSPPHTCPIHELPGASLDAGPDTREIFEVWGCNMAVRRFALAEVGPFREGLRFGQDWEWQHRARLQCLKILYVPEAALVHVRHGSDLRLTSLVEQHVRRGWFVAGELRAAGELGGGAARRALATSGRALTHALSARCARGLADSAREGGRAARLLFTRN